MFPHKCPCHQSSCLGPLWTSSVEELVDWMDLEIVFSALSRSLLRNSKESYCQKCCLSVCKEQHLVQGCQSSAFHEHGIWLLYNNKELNLGFAKYFHIPYNTYLDTNQLVGSAFLSSLTSSGDVVTCRYGDKYCHEGRVEMVTRWQQSFSWGTYGLDLNWKSWMRGLPVTEQMMKQK